MTPTRRHVILGAIGATLATAGAGGAFLATREPSKARTPWRAIETDDEDPRLRAFRHAVLAPNPHNRQPWMIELTGADGAVLRCDLDRRLPETDPFDRQITIGLGCFLELARIAASTRGRQLEIAPFPEGEPEARLDRRPVAALRFVADPAVTPDPLHQWIAVRRSTKAPFDLDRPVGEDSLAKLATTSSADATVRAARDPMLVRRLRALTWTAWEIEARTPRTFMESVRLMRIGKAEIETAPDGIALGGPVIDTLRLLGQIDRASLSDPGSSAFRAGLDSYRAMLASAMAYCWVVTPGNTRRHQLAAGAAYVRANLAATGLGLAFHPVSQALQEFDEMAATRAAADRELGLAPGQRLQMLARLGYGPAVPPAPRWPLETKLTRA